MTETEFIKAKLELLEKNNDRLLTKLNEVSNTLNTIQGWLDALGEDEEDDKLLVPYDGFLEEYKGEE